MGTKLVTTHAYTTNNHFKKGKEKFYLRLNLTKKCKNFMVKVYREELRKQKV